MPILHLRLIVSLTGRKIFMYEKKQAVFVSPDLAQLQVVVIDHRTKIYIGRDEDPEEAKERYLSRVGAKKP
jgi:hypothetical protein